MRETDNVSVVTFIWSTGSVLLASMLGGGCMFTLTAPATAADQMLKVPALHAVNNRTLVTEECTAATRLS